MMLSLVSSSFVNTCLHFGAHVSCLCRCQHIFACTFLLITPNALQPLPV